MWFILYLWAVDVREGGSGNEAAVPGRSAVFHAGGSQKLRGADEEKQRRSCGGVSGRGQWHFCNFIFILFYFFSIKKNAYFILILFQIDELEQQAHQLRCQNSTYHEELLQARIKIDSYNSKVSELESVNAQLKVKYRLHFKNFVWKKY